MLRVCRLQKPRPRTSLVRCAVTGARNYGQHLCGYTINQVEDVPDIDAQVTVLTHDKTGARHLHVAREDSNNTFCVGFRTFPVDNTGMSHILEHTTLCGSKKFPVRDPFFRMLTRSVSNFMNAFTANDWTLYIFSTQNQRDFQNLLDVYLDCVFFPQIRELDFMQEGWRLEHSKIDDPLSPIVFKGVVFNEMKGYFANSENLYAQGIQNKLYPTTAYSHVSGGTSAGIVDLKWENLKRFHSACYHPSNSYFITYGDIPIENHLETISKSALEGFGKKVITYTVPTEPTWQSLRREAISCPPNSLFPPSKQTTCSVSYKLAPITDLFESFVLKVLCLLLVDGPSSPFHKSLLEANLGSEFSPGTGYSEDTYDSYFSVGLQGIEGKHASLVEDIIHSTFKQLVSKGFSNEQVEAVLNRVELETKEPKKNFGLIISTGVMTPWIHGGNPVNLLKIQQHTKKFKEEFYSDRNLLQSKIREYFMENDHRLHLLMQPDDNYEVIQKRHEAEQLFDTLSKMSGEEIAKVYDTGHVLRKEQVSPVQNDCLPSINLCDIKREVDSIEELCLDGSPPVHIFTQPTNGLSYVNVSFDFSHLAEDLKPYVAFFSYIISRMGAGELSYDELTLQCETHSNGFSVAPVITPDYKSLGHVYQELLCSSYCLDAKFATMMSLWEKIFNQFDISNEKRLLDLLKQQSSSMAQEISDYGHLYAKILSSSSLTPSAFYSEQMSGLSQVKFLKQLLDMDLSDVRHRLEAIGKFVFTTNNIRVSVHTSVDNVDTVKEGILTFLRNCPNIGEVIHDYKHDFEVLHGIKHQVTLPYPVNFIGQSVRTVPYSDPDAPSLKVMSKLLSSRYLHKHIREIGGAYGSGATDQNGILSFMSYRDPNISPTLDVIEQSLDWIRSGSYNDSDIAESKISVFSELDAPKAPGGKGLLSFLRRIPIAQRQQFRDSLFQVTKEDLVKVGEKYLDFSKSNTVVIGGGNNDRMAMEKDWREFVL